jgi:acetoin:2,6-dichlorophenolindophenol oxidoreductase subunit alpha
LAVASNRNDRSIDAYRRMLKIRHFEETAERIHAAGGIPGALHTCAGQEGEIVGACLALRTDDYMVGNHRSHGHPIAKGAELRPLMAELLAKSTGICKGKGGSMHLSDFAVGSLGETSIVGSGLPVAVGAALGSKMQGLDRVALVFFGDGASNEGTFHESCNLASVWKLPVIFLCENNGYGMSTPASQVVSVKDIAERGKAYSIPGVIVDGQDVDAMFDVTSQAVERARTGGGPTIVEAKTYRYADHAVNMGRILLDRGSEVDEWRLRDPITLYRAKLEGGGVAAADLDAIEAEVVAEVADALEYARSSPYPDQAEAFDDVFDERLPIPAYLQNA